MTTEQSMLTPIEGINEFYRLKDKYETGYYEKYIKPIVKSNKSKREKRLEFSRLPKHECINCKRNVDTIFNIFPNTKGDFKKYIVKCGDLQEPCPLDIQITYGNRKQFDEIIKEGLDFIEYYKLNIIIEKNNALFFSKNVVDVFEDLTNKLKEYVEITGYIIETNILRNNNPEKLILIKQTIDEFGKGAILPFKQMIKEYDETNNELILNQAMTFYINEMIPKLKEILELKYDVNIVEFDESDNIYKLIQLPNSLESNEFFHQSDDKIIKFVKGVAKEKKQTRKDNSELRANVKNKGKNKTKKIKPIAELVLIEEDEPDTIVNDEQGSLENKFDKVSEEEEKYSTDKRQISNQEPNINSSVNNSVNNGNTLANQQPKPDITQQPATTLDTLTNNELLDIFSSNSNST